MANLAALLARIQTATAAQPPAAELPGLVQVPPEPILPAEPLPLIPLEMRPRQPQAGDLTLDQARADSLLVMSANDRDAYDSGDLSEDLETATARLFATQRRTVESLGERTALAMGGPTDLTDEPAETWCPACYPGETLHEVAQRVTVDPTLTYTLTLDTLSARCARGCEPEAIASAIAALVHRNEHHEQATAQNKAVATAAASVRLSTVLGQAGPQRWIIPGMLPEDGLVILSGTSGDGKTFTAMHLGLCLATGTKWFSYPAAKHRTLLLLLEGAKADQRRRIALLAAGLDIPIDSLDGHLDIYPLPEFHADDPKSLARLIELIKTLGHRAVIIDNLTAARENTDENSTANMSAALKPLAALAEQHHLSVVLLHHANKQGELRGSSAIRQHADLVFELRRANAKNASRIIMTRTKDRYGQSLEELRYRFLDSLDERGKVQAIIPSQLDPERPDPLDVDPLIPGPINPEDRHRPIDIELTPINRARMTDILGVLPASAQRIYDAIRQGTRPPGLNRIKALRDQLERDGKIVCREGVWYKV